MVLRLIYCAYIVVMHLDSGGYDVEFALLIHNVIIAHVKVLASRHVFYFLVLPPSHHKKFE
jgi:hypothetical protein